MSSRRVAARLPLVLFLAALGACAPAARGPAAAAPLLEPEDLGPGPEIIEVVVRTSTRSILGDVAYSLPVEANSWVEAELDFLVQQRSQVIGRWIERGDPYQPYIREILAQYGVPTDLYFLAMIESGFVPTARSRAGAVGLWQFMPATGRQMGLRVDSVVDERMDPIRSTHAAARHLRQLHRAFGGDWALAAAAYNAGSGRISRGLQRFEVSTFWDLAVEGDLAEETKHYVPRLYAMTIIGRNRERFGFSPPPADAPVLAYDSVRVDLSTPFAELARIGTLEEGELRRLNPHLLRGATPPGDYWVWVPGGKGEAVQRAFLDSEYRKAGGNQIYVVRSGDSLGRIAQRSGVPAPRVRALNPRVDFDRLQIGERLTLPGEGARRLADANAAAAASQASAAPAARAARTTPAAGRGSVEHVVESGESLWTVARRHGVSVADLREANGISGEVIRPGQTLRIPGAAPAAVEHTVRNGETLWGIAREYRSTVAAIRSVNGILDEVIVPGQKLTIPR